MQVPTEAKHVLDAVLLGGRVESPWDRYLRFGVAGEAYPYASKINNHSVAIPIGITLKTRPIAGLGNNQACACSKSDNLSDLATLCTTREGTNCSPDYACDQLRRDLFTLEVVGATAVDFAPRRPARRTKSRASVTGCT